MKKKIMAALLAGVMLLQQPVSGWCAQNTELTQKSEARQESESSEDTADGSEDDTEAIKRYRRLHGTQIQLYRSSTP